MAPSARRWRLVGLLGLAILSTIGCNPLTSLYFLAVGLDPKVEPDCRLASEDKNKEVKVVILTYCPLEMRQELLGADRELSSLLGQKLLEGTRANKEKITIVSPTKVQHYKDEHPNWQSNGPEVIGKYFRADYVIDLEINTLTLFQARSANQMLRGNAEISITVHDLSKPGEEPIFKDEYACEYPPSREVPISDCSPQKFRMQFLTRMATDLSWKFTSHPVADHFPCD
ncbi:MAG: hypothetical protein K2R98_10990 [Gemmataceae bacterium]|nr:hypothetical protein [Gemmataceae bacterium]